MNNNTSNNNNELVNNYINSLSSYLFLLALFTPGR